MQKANILFLVILAAYGLPRLLALQDLPVAPIYRFEDMSDHLIYLDTKVKTLTLSDTQRTHARESAFRVLPAAPRRSWWLDGPYVTALPFALLFGPGSTLTVQLTNLLFSAIMGVGLALLGAALTSRVLGLWAVLFMVLCPGLVASTCYLSLDYPLAAMTTLGLYLLFRTDGFSTLRGTLLFGLWSGLGVWMKLTYVVYLLPCALVVLGHSLLRLRDGRVRLLARCAAGLLLGVGLLLLLERPDFADWGKASEEHLASTVLPGGKVAALTPAWLLGNAAFAAAQMPLPLLLFCLPGLGLLIRRLRHVKPSSSERGLRLESLLLLFLASTYVLLTLMPNKMERYVQPLYPVLCLLGAAWVYEWCRPRLRTLALGVAAGLTGLLLVVTYLQPIPWFMTDLRGRRPEDLELLLMSPLRFEHVLPGHDLHVRLRDRRYAADCDLRPLFAQIRRLVGPQVTASHPLGLAVYRRQGTPLAPELELLLRHALPGLTLEIRDRFLAIEVLHSMTSLPLPLADLPYSLIIHQPEASLTQAASFLRVVQQVPLTLSCEKAQVPVQLSLVRSGCTLEQLTTRGRTPEMGCP